MSCPPSRRFFPGAHCDPTPYDLRSGSTRPLRRDPMLLSGSRCASCTQQGGMRQCRAQHVRQFCDRVDGHRQAHSTSRLVKALPVPAPNPGRRAPARRPPRRQQPVGGFGRMGQPAPLVGGGLQTERRQTSLAAPSVIAAGRLRPGQGLRRIRSPTASVSIRNRRDRAIDSRRSGCQQQGRPVPAAGAAGRAGRR